MVDREDLIPMHEKKIAAQKELQENDLRAKALMSQMHSRMDSEQGDNAATSSEAMEKITAYLANHSETKDYEYLVRGATLVCRCGSHKRRINLPQCHGVYIGNHPMIHELECIPGDRENITFFGICEPTQGELPGDTVAFEKTTENSKDGSTGVVTGKKCNPVIIGVWQDTYSATRIVDNGAKNSGDRMRVKSKDIPPVGECTVTNTSFLVCKYGGLIEPINSGQNEVNADEHACDDEPAAESEEMHEHFKDFPEGLVLKKGDKNILISEVQYLLNKLGYLQSDNDITYKFGGATKSAIQLYQLNYGLKMDGSMIDKELYDHLVTTYLTEKGELPDGMGNEKNPRAEINQIPGVPIIWKNGKYYYDYSIQINQFLREKSLECQENGVKQSYEEYVAEQAKLGNFNPSLGGYVGVDLIDPAWWFYKKVEPGADWDLKVDSKWAKAFPSLPYQSTKFQFVYNSQIIDSENLGNITYGYWGSACGFSADTLFLGGGFANNPLTMFTKNNGESEDDHAMIQRGIDMYKEEHPYFEPKR